MSVVSGAVLGLPGSVLGLIAQAPPGADRGEEFGKTSPIALVVILLLLVATVLLIRSMNKRLKNVPASFDTDIDADGEQPSRPDGSSDDEAADGGPLGRPEGSGRTGSP